MKKITFYKYQGTGNDFVMIDNRDCLFDRIDIVTVKRLCNRQFGVGSDGLILIQNHNTLDLEMVYYNSDGNKSSMCGNGARCFVAFAKYLNLITHKIKFLASDGEHSAYVENNIIAVKMRDVKNVEIHSNHLFLDTGSPHHVSFVTDLKTYNVFENGRKIAHGAPYFEQGSNVNFVEKECDDVFRIRTYERGVEDETLSCGTGATAAAIAAYEKNKTSQKEVKIKVEGGELTINFKKTASGYKDIYLKGRAECVFKGEIFI